jgi:hypothetical protein
MCSGVWLSPRSSIRGGAIGARVRNTSVIELAYIFEKDHIDRFRAVMDEAMPQEGL